MRWTTQEKTLGLLGLSLLAVPTGVIAGLGAVVFRGLIGVFHNLLFLGKLSIPYDANAHTPPSPWGAFVILVPVVGALGVSFLVKNFAPEAKGHGVPEVMEAIYYNNGVIRPIVAVIKSLASALSIGSGGSVGREGPIVQIGATFGSTLGQVLRLAAWQRVTLIGAGAGAGIAATFNTPVGGVLFAVELMLHEVSARTLIPVIISTATATYIGRLFFGDHPSFVIRSLEILYFKIENPVALIGYVVLGAILGFACVVYIRSIYAAEDLFDDRVRGSYYRRHLLGMLVVGVIIYALMAAYGHYYVQGVGYATVQDILSGVSLPVYLLLLLFVLKMLVTALTLGSGASGGIFSPSLFLGATLGGAYGVFLRHLLPGLDISPPAFAIAGMAGVVAGATGAAMTAIVMVFEMTLDYNVIIPMTITVAISYGVRKALLRESIYTLKLVRRGRCVPDALQTNLHFLTQAKNMMDRHIRLMQSSDKIAELAATVADGAAIPDLIVAEGDRIAGYVTAGQVSAALERGQQATLGDIARTDYAIVPDEMRLLEVVSAMRAGEASVALVALAEGSGSASGVQGIVSKDQILDSISESTELFCSQPTRR